MKSKSARPKPVKPKELFCPNCSLPRQRVQFDGEVYQCGNCQSWWHPGTIQEFSSLFDGAHGPRGFDPATGFEAQARPGKAG